MTASIIETTYLGVQAMTLQTSQLELTVVPEWGSNAISMKWKKDNDLVELLRGPSSIHEYEQAPVQFGVPILFPPNRISDGEFTFNGQTYSFDLSEPDKNNHIHGFVYQKPWKVTHTEVKEDYAKLVTSIESKDHPDIVAQFPHSFRIEMVYLLEGASLKKHAVITNLSDKEFPWGIGYHTTFLFPEETSHFSLAAEKQWELNERLLPTEKLIQTGHTTIKEGMSLHHVELDDAFLAKETALESNQAVMTLEHEQIRIRYKADESFKHWVVYNADGTKGFVCPEPYTWITNAPKLSLDKELTGVQTLASNQTIVVKTEIDVSSL
ncbi:aldose 1-epimerase [Alkalihalobacillus sp. NPDC078783]